MEVVSSRSVLTAYGSSSSSSVSLKSIFFTFATRRSSSRPSLALGNRRRRSISEICSGETEAPGMISATETLTPNPTPTQTPTLPKMDKRGRFSSPRAARELALSILYASCLQGCDPVRLLQNRLNGGPRENDFSVACLSEYDHMSFGGPPVTVHSLEERDELLRCDEAQSLVEAEVLGAPPKLVYSKLLLRMTHKFLVAVSQHWDAHVIHIHKIAPPNWKDEAGSRILELCILHLAMAEISVLQTRHQIVINEAVDLAKRFCDGAAPRIINGCLRTFVNELQQQST